MDKNPIYIPDSLFPTDNELEIPSLLLNVQPTACEIPFLCYGEQRRTKDMNHSGSCDLLSVLLSLHLANNQV
jgi:hypothetical protein